MASISFSVHQTRSISQQFLHSETQRGTKQSLTLWMYDSMPKTVWYFTFPPRRSYQMCVTSDSG